MNKVEEIIKKLKRKGVAKNRAGMARFGINVTYAFGVPMPVVRKLAKELGKDHKLALALWKTKVHEARILAGLIDDPTQVTEKQMDSWVKCFNSWDVCDQLCFNLFDKVPLGYVSRHPEIFDQARCKSNIL